jgi:hypothetical protein
MNNDKIKPTPPIRPEGPPVRRIINEKVINRKELDAWDNRKKQ